MLSRFGRFLDLRPGEGLPVFLTFLYIAVVVASFLLAKPIRNGLFLGQYGSHALVYVYAAVPVVLSVFVPLYTRVAARFGSRSVTIATLIFFSANVVAFWYAFRFHRFWLLPGIFYVWVNCFGVVAPVQAWSFANSLFDTRQAKRVFALVGSGASLGAITGGFLARVLVGPVGGAVNLMLVLALLILTAAAIVAAAHVGIRRKGLARRGRPITRPFSETWREIAESPYLRLIAALVLLVAMSTQLTGFQLNIVAESRFGRDADALTEFFGTFNFMLGSVSVLVQLLVTGRALRRFGLAATILILPMALGTGSFLILLLPAFWSVLLTNAADQALRFSVDKPTYELLYLPIAPGQRVHAKNAIDIVINRIGDGVGAVLLGVATGGFLMLPGLNLDVRQTAAINVCLISAWLFVAWRLRSEYVRTIHESIHRHRIDTERTTVAVLDRSAAEALNDKLAAPDPNEVKYALELIEAQQARSWHPALRELLSHPDPEIRRRALAILSGTGDRDITNYVMLMLRDPDIGVRTEALLYLSRESGVDPLLQIQELGDFEDFSIRAGTAAFLAAPGPAQNLEAARVIVEAMATSSGAAGARDRAEAARLIGMVPDGLVDLLPSLIADPELDVAGQAVRSARGIAREELAPALLSALGRPEIADQAAAALARLGNSVVPQLASWLRDDAVPLDVRREIPAVLFRVGTTEAEQVLVESLLQSDSTLRHRVIASLNKLRVLHPDVRVDRSVIELLLAAEISGHYRTYQLLGPLQSRLKEGDPVIEAVRHSIEQEVERIFRLMALLFPTTGLHDAYVGVRSANPVVRANALEFLENVLRPELRQLLVPLLDSQVSVEERIAIADRLVGAPLETTEQAVATMLSSEDPWLRSCAVYAVGALNLRQLEPELRRFEDADDADLRQAVDIARRRLAGEAVTAPEPQVPPPADMDVGVGAG
jgi:AAA family ATP:ADP antiporter